MNNRGRVGDGYQDTGNRLGKDAFQVHGLDEKGRTVLQRQLRRRQLLPFVAQLRPCLVAMEACGSAHYWVREIARRGHEALIIGERDNGESELLTRAAS